MFEELEYKEGKLFRKGKEVGWLQKNKYRMFSYEGKKYLVHRVIWFLHKGSWPLYDLDHINEDKQDNRIENLRDVKDFINLHNISKPNKDNKTSGLRGVHFHSSTGRWRSQITFNKVVFSLGVFSDPDIAKAAYETKKAELLAGGY